MVIKLLYKNILIKIKKSFGRYVSLLIIILVGVGFFAGIQASSPDIIASVDDYYDNQNLMDFKIVGSLGLTDEDVNALKSLNNVSAVIPSYSLDVLAQDKAIRIHAIEEQVNTLKLVDGRMPQNGKECVADSKSYKTGDKITVTGDMSEKLKNSEFTVVGTAVSPLYLSEEYGNTAIGDGKLAAFIFVNRDNFILDAYTEIYITAGGTKDALVYSKEYEDIVSQVNDELVKIKPERESARYQEIYTKAGNEIDANDIKLDTEKKKGEKELAQAKTKLDDNALKLKKAKDELNGNAAALQKNIKAQTTDFEAAKDKIANGWKEIDSALESSGIKKEDLDSKIKELDTAINTMTEQLNGLPADSAESRQLSETLSRYSASYEGLVKLRSFITGLTEQEEQLNRGIEKFNTEIAKAENEIAKGRTQLAENEKKLDDGYKEYNENLNKFNREMADAQDKIEDAKGKLAEIEKAKWYIFDRDAATGYSILKSYTDMITSVANVFPLFFIVIVMLMTSNTMARMIAEERGELGALTSLGYSDKSIVSTYLLYVLSASALGVTAGFFTGCSVLPKLIYACVNLILPPLIIGYDMITFSLILAAAFILMTLVTVISCSGELKQRPAALLRPVPPKKGQTIILEKAGFIWKHLSFTWKVTMRNIFRYKSRAFMTIAGVAGCTALLLAAFGLRDSMNGFAEKQYGEIFKYTNLIVLKGETKNIDGKLESLLTKEKIEAPVLIGQTAFTCGTGGKVLDAYLIVPEDEEAFYKYYDLKSILTGDSIALEDNRVIITRKLSEAYKIGKGDSITVKDTDNVSYTLAVSDVAENYMQNYIYMNKNLYSKVFGAPAAYNMIASMHSGDEKALSGKLIDSGLVLNVNFKDEILKKVLEDNKGLNNIMVLIVFVASLLAVIVLYNLTSINMSERRREIATLKVLGFSDVETNQYIYREAFILTLISIGAGLVLGILFHRFVIGIIEGEAVVFLKNIKGVSFIWAFLITIIASAVMQAVTYFKLQKIDMIESLKSVE